MHYCNAPHPDGRPERCVMPESVPHEGHHQWIDGQNIDPATVPVVHLPVGGFADGAVTIDHLSGTCVHCDAMRWRAVVASCEAAGIEVEPSWLDPTVTPA